MTETISIELLTIFEAISNPHQGTISSMWQNKMVSTGACYDSDTDPLALWPLPSIMQLMCPKSQSKKTKVRLY